MYDRWRWGTKADLLIKVVFKRLRAVSTTSLFLPHKVKYHIAVAKCYFYVTHNFMWKKKRGRRHSP